MLALLVGLGRAVEPGYVVPFQGVVFSAPAATAYCRIDPHGITVIPNGRLLTPRGRQLLVEPHPYGLALSADGRTLITANSGTEPFSFSIVHDPLSRSSSTAVDSRGGADGLGRPQRLLHGAGDSPAGRRSPYSTRPGGDDGTVMVWNYVTRQRRRDHFTEPEFRGRVWSDSYAGDLVLSRDEKYLYVVDQMNFRVVTVDVGRRRDRGCRSQWDDIRLACACPPTETILFVANIGMFEYSVVDGFDPQAISKKPA